MATWHDSSPGPITAAEFKARLADLLEALCGDGGRLVTAVAGWLRRARGDQTELL